MRTDKRMKDRAPSLDFHPVTPDRWQDLETLFGAGTELTVYRWLYQPGEFASDQRVTVLGPRRKMIENVRKHGNPFGDPDSEGDPDDLYCC